MGTLFPLWRYGRLRMATDGSGVTSLVCAAGCPLDCKFCINPESKPFGSQKNVTPEELYETVKCDGLYFAATGGGVTFGGGEPLLHADFICEFRKIIPECWHIYAESSLYIPEKNVITAARAIDHFFIDIKDANDRIYREYTGRSNKRVINNLKLLISCAGAENVTVRVPLIPGHNTDEDRAKTKEVLSDAGVVSFDFFKYVTPRKKAEKHLDKTDGI